MPRSPIFAVLLQARGLIRAADVVGYTRLTGAVS
jgi:hypothetical protein